MRRLGELALIADYLAPLAVHPGAFGLKDDAALLAKLPANGLVITSDGLVAGAHFFEDDDPGDAAFKALAANVSDLAAKAAKPLAYTLTLALSEAPSEEWARSFAAGLKRAQDEFGIALLGGDTVTARGAWWMSITAFGARPRPGDWCLARAQGLRHPVRQRHAQTRRSACKSVSAIKTRQPPSSATHRDFLLKRYLYPEPRLALAPALATHASAAMDVSDGLALDLSRMCAASGGQLQRCKFPRSRCPGRQAP